ARLPPATLPTPRDSALCLPDGPVPLASPPLCGRGMAAHHAGVAGRRTDVRIRCARRRAHRATLGRLPHPHAALGRPSSGAQRARCDFFGARWQFWDEEHVVATRADWNGTPTTSAYTRTVGRTMSMSSHR